MIRVDAVVDPEQRLVARLAIGIHGQIVGGPGAVHVIRHGENVEQFLQVGVYAASWNNTVGNYGTGGWIVQNHHAPAGDCLGEIAAAFSGGRYGQRVLRIRKALRQQFL